MIGHSAEAEDDEDDKRSVPQLTPEAPLDAWVQIRSDGFVVTAQGQSAGRLCGGDRGEKLTVRRAKDHHDFAGLRSCLTRIRGSHPAFAGEQDVSITADAGVPYQWVIETMDAVRETDAGTPLFPNVRFGVTR